MLALGILVAYGADVAIVEGPARVRARRPARFHVTLLHAGGGLPAVATVHFGDGSAVTLRYVRGSAPDVFDAESAHAFARSGRYAVSVRTAGGRLLASESVTVVPAPQPPRPRAAASEAPGAAGAGAPLIVSPGVGAPADPRHSGILVAPGLPAAPPPILVNPAQAGVPAASTPADLPAATLRPRAPLEPGAPAVAPVPTPTATSRVTTGDR